MDNLINAAIIIDCKISKEWFILKLEKYNNINLLKDACCKQEIFDLLKTGNCNFIIIDINIFNMYKININEFIDNINYSIKILVLSQTISNNYLELIYKWVNGIVLKDNIREIELAIDKILKGGSHFSEQIYSNIIINNRKKNNKELKISPRQKEIIPLTLQRYKNKEIAEKLFISIKTVEYHKSKLKNNTGAKSTVEAIRIIKKKNII